MKNSQKIPFFFGSPPLVEDEIIQGLNQVMREQEHLSSRVAEVARVAERQRQEREVKPSSGERFGVVERFLPPTTSSTSEEELKGLIEARSRQMKSLF